KRVDLEETAKVHGDVHTRFFVPQRDTAASTDKDREVKERPEPVADTEKTRLVVDALDKILREALEETHVKRAFADLKHEPVPLFDELDAVLEGKPTVAASPLDALEPSALPLPASMYVNPPESTAERETQLALENPAFQRTAEQLLTQTVFNIVGEAV